MTISYAVTVIEPSRSLKHNLNQMVRALEAGDNITLCK